MRKTITVDQYNIALTRKQFSEQLIAALADYGEIPAEHEATLLSKFVSVFTNFHNPHKEYGSNRLFHNDLKEALEKDAAYSAAPSLQGLLTVAQLVMNSWEKDAFRSQQRAELGADTKRKGQIASTTQAGKRSRADGPPSSDALKATIGEHCQGCGRARHHRDECRGRDIPGWNAEGPWIGSKAYKAADATNPIPRLYPSLGTPPSRTPSTAPAARTPSSKRPASPTSRIHYLPTHCCTSLVTVTTPTSTLCIAHAATAPLHSPSLLYSTLVLTPLRLSIGK